MRQMRKLACIIISLLTFIACSEKASPEEEAVKAAKKYYEYIIKGHYDKYIDGFSRYDSIPDDYREQLITGVKQFAITQKEKNGGMREVRAVRGERDSLNGYTNAYLVVCFGDSINEEIVVPMIEQNGIWRIK